MKYIKRELLLCLSLTAFVFVCALAWGSPFLAGKVSPAEQLRTAQGNEFHGVIFHGGNAYLLRESSGQSLRLDNSALVNSGAIASLEGKAVRITGTLDPGAKSIRVERVTAAI